MKMAQPDYDETVKQAALLAVDLYAWHVASRGSSLSSPPEPPPGVDPDKLKASEDLATKELAKPVVKKSICAALKSVGGDVFEISKIVAATLVSLSIAGVVALPTTPLSLAAAALVVVKAGIAIYCCNS